jgi:hypothetical protein
MQSTIACPDARQPNRKECPLMHGYFLSFAPSVEFSSNQRPGTVVYFVPDLSKVQRALEVRPG